jgi:hypothetical protein
LNEKSKVRKENFFFPADEENIFLASVDFTQESWAILQTQRIYLNKKSILLKD